MQNSKDVNSSSGENKTPVLKPDADTVHTTDPQEHMEGPVSNAMRGAGDAFDTSETQEEADQEKKEAGS